MGIKKLLLFNILFILLAVTVLAETCRQRPDFLDRLRDDCQFDNGICDDAEYPFKYKDCELTTEAVSCKGGRCIFNEIWLAKLAIGALIFLLLGFNKKKDYLPVIIIIALFLMINFSDNGYAGMIKDDFSINATNTVINETVQEIPDTLLYNYGYRIMPSNPMMGSILILLFLFMVLRYGKRKVDEFKPRGRRR